MIQFEPVKHKFIRHTEYEVADALGYIPGMVTEGIGIPVREQLDANYVAGWHKFEGFTFDKDQSMLTYPSDPAIYAIARAQVGDETILVFPHAWVLILQADGSWEVARMN